MPVPVPNWGLAEIQFAGNSPDGTTGPPGIVVPPGTLNPRLARFMTVPRSPLIVTGTVPDGPLPTPLYTFTAFARLTKSPLASASLKAVLNRIACEPRCVTPSTGPQAAAGFAGLHPVKPGAIFRPRNSWSNSGSLPPARVTCRALKRGVL